MATKAELEAKIERERLELVALRNKARALPDGPERDAIQAQRDALRAQQKTTTRELEIATNQSPATGQFEGVDANSGQYRYKNPETGTSFLANTAPTASQQQQSGQTIPTPPATATATEARPETAPAEVQTPATTPQFVDTVSPGDVPPSSDPELPQPAGAGRGFVNPPLVEPAPQEIDTPLLTPAESIAQAQSSPEPVDAATAAADFNTNTNTDVLTAIGAPADQPDPYDNRFTRQEADAAAATENESTAETARLNRYDNAAAESAILQRTREQPAIQAQFQSPASGDWRVRLRLAPNAEYLYKDSSNEILKPLLASDGVVFPYMPTISTSYNASYESTELTHSNYRGQFYKSSYVGDISLSGTFTAQDTVEASYLLAVIHFFRSVTKMFYGQDAERGAPPPLVYLIGLGQYQFNNQPCVVSSFNYSLPTDVDYIRTKPNNYNINLGPRQTKSDNGPFGQISSIVNRLRNAALPQGALPGIPDQSLVTAQSVSNIDNNTYVPTRMDISLTLLPIQTRSQQSQQFSVKQFANGNLLKGGFW